jgi:hypothetical protein
MVCKFDHNKLIRLCSHYSFVDSQNIPQSIISLITVKTVFPSCIVNIHLCSFYNLNIGACGSVVG